MDLPERLGYIAKTHLTFLASTEGATHVCCSTPCRLRNVSHDLGGGETQLLIPGKWRPGNSGVRRQTLHFRRRLVIEQCEPRQLLAADVALTGASLQNSANPWDVNGDEVVSVADLLPIVHLLREHGAIDAADAPASTPFADVTGDELISHADLRAEIDGVRLAGFVTDDPYAEDGPSPLAAENGWFDFGFGEGEGSSSGGGGGSSSGGGGGNPPTLSIANAGSVFETGGNSLSFVVTLTPAQGGSITYPVTVEFAPATQGIPDLAGADDFYIMPTSPLTFYQGEVTKTITVIPTVDSTVEPDEVVSIWLAPTATNANVDPNKREGRGTIWNDDVIIHLLNWVNYENSGDFKARYWAEGASTALNHSDGQGPFKIELIGNTADGTAKHGDPDNDYEPVSNDVTMVNASATESNPFLLENLTVNNDSLVETPATEYFVYSVQKGANTTAQLNVQISGGCRIDILDDDN